MATTNAELLTARASPEASSYTLTRVRMCCGKTRYSLDASLQPGDELRLEDADGCVHHADYNASTTPRPTKLTRILSSRDDLVASYVPRQPGG